MAEERSAVVRLRFRLTAAELASGLWSRQIRRIPFLLFLLAIVSGIRFYSAMSQPGRVGTLGLNAMYFLTVGALGVGVLYLATLVASRRQLSSSPMLAGDQSFEFTSDGFQYTSEAGASEMRWQALHRVTETRTLLLFYWSEAVFTVIPKRAFSSAADLDSLLQTVSGTVTNLKLRE